MQCPHHCSPDIYRVMAECWQEKPGDRPTFKQIVPKMAQLHAQSLGKH